MEGVDNDRQIQEGQPGVEEQTEAVAAEESADAAAEIPQETTATGDQGAAPAEEADPTPGMEDEAEAAEPAGESQVDEEEAVAAEAEAEAEAEVEEEEEEEGEAGAEAETEAEDPAEETVDQDGAADEETVAAVPPAPPAEVEPDPIEPIDPSQIRTKDILRGLVTQVRDDHLLVNVGVEADGVVPLSELTLGPRQVPADGFDIGQQVYVEVLSIDQRDGIALLVSERRARAQRAWDDLEEALEKQTIIKAPVIEEVKGGLVVDVGVRAFMPASHVDRGYVSNLGAYVGRNVRAQVVELDKTKNRVILSQRKVLEAEHQVLKAATWAELAEGQVRQGVVKGLTDFGAFIDLGGVDGLLHVSEMAWGRVEHPRDVVEEGEEIEVKVLKVDRERERVSLGLKQVLPDPWVGLDERYTEGSIVEGRVERIAPFGAFVQLEPGIEGLVHISQMADHRVRAVEDVVSEGETIPVKILRIQAADRRISLSLKEARHDLGQLETARRESEAETDTDEAQGASDAGQTTAQAQRPTPSATRPAPQPSRPKRSRPERRRRQSSGPQRTLKPQAAPISRDNGGDNMTLGEMFGDLLEETKERLEQEQANQNNQQQEAEAETAAAEEPAADVDSGDGDDTENEL